MYCPYCGAKIEEGALYCAYCGHENEQLAGERQKQEVEGVYARLNTRLHRPQRAVRKTTRFLLIGTGALLGVFLLAVLASFLFAEVGSQAAYERQQKRVAQLEELYQAGDYAAIDELMWKMDDSYQAVYDKYSAVSDLYWRLSMVLEDYEEGVRLVREDPQWADLLEYDLENLFEVLVRCDELEEAGYVYGEQQAVEYFRQEADALLREVFLLTEEEIETGKGMVLKEEPDYSPLYTISAQRIAGGGA